MRNTRKLLVACALIFIITGVASASGDKNKKSFKFSPANENSRIDTSIDASGMMKPALTVGRIEIVKNGSDVSEAQKMVSKEITAIKKKIPESVKSRLSSYRVRYGNRVKSIPFKSPRRWTVSRVLTLTSADDNAVERTVQSVLDTKAAALDVRVRVLGIKEIVPKAVKNRDVQKLVQSAARRWQRRARAIARGMGCTKAMTVHVRFKTKRDDPSETGGVSKSPAATVHVSGTAMGIGCSKDQAKALKNSKSRDAFMAKSVQRYTRSMLSDHAQN